MKMGEKFAQPFMTNASVVKTIITNSLKMQQKPTKNLTKISENNGAKFTFVCLFKDGHVKNCTVFIVFAACAFVCLFTALFMLNSIHPIHVGYEIFYIIANPK